MGDSSPQYPVRAVDSALASVTTAIHQLIAENQRLRAQVDNRKCLTEREVRKIREYRSKGRSQAELADMFDVNPATISRIVRNQYWKGVR